MRKILLITVICLTAVISQITASAATEDIKVKVNGELVKFDVKPFVENGRTLVPIRNIAEALKFKVDWDGDTSTATLSKGDSVIKLVLNSDTALVNGREVKMDVTAGSKDGRTVVPLRFVSESLGCTVDWFETSKIAAINEKTEDGKEALFFTRLLQSEEYEPIDYGKKGYSYASKDKKAKYRVIGDPKVEIDGQTVQANDVQLELYEFDKYTRNKVKEVLKFCFPNDYETVYMYLIVTLRGEAYEYFNEFYDMPGVNCACHNNRRVSTNFVSEGNVASVIIYAEGYVPKPEWYRFDFVPDESVFIESFRQKWDLYEYTIEDYKKVRGNIFKFYGYTARGVKYFTFGQTPPLGVIVEKTFETEQDAMKAGYLKDEDSSAFGDYYMF